MPRAAAKTGKNLVANSSFEQSRMEGHPDCWEAQAAIHLMPDEKANGLDSRNPFHGKYCYRITRPVPGEARALSADRMTLKAGKTYTFSCYLRADRDNQKALLYLQAPGANVTVGTGWERYWQTVTIPEEKDVPAHVHICHTGDVGTGNLYLDAVQLEEGPEPTDYES